MRASPSVKSLSSVPVRGRSPVSFLSSLASVALVLPVAACTATIGEEGEGGGSGGAEQVVPATGGSEAAPSGPSFTEISAFIVDNCSEAGCHGETIPADPDTFTSYLPELLAGTDLHSTLTTYTVSRCGDAPLVVANNSAGSALMMLSLGQCGEPNVPFLMPYSCFTAPCYTDEEATFLNAWIDAGALAQ